MSRRQYINNAATVETTGSLTSGATTVTVSDASSFPASYPYTAGINLGEADAEVVLVTAAAGNTLTITRGYDGTAAQAHAANATFAHVAVKADYDEANSHINSDNNVHGIAGNVVGDTDAQTLTNKTLTDPAITSPTITGGGSVAGAVTLTGDVVIDHSGTAGQALTIKARAADESLVLLDSTGTIVGTIDEVGNATLKSLTLSGNLAFSGSITGTGYVGEMTAVGPVTLNSTSAKAGAAAVSFTLTRATRVEISVSAQLNPATSTEGHYEVEAGYNSGAAASIASFVGVGIPFSIQADSTKFRSGFAFGTASLAAGTYTAYASLVRSNGGDAADAFNNMQVLVKAID